MPLILGFNETSIMESEGGKILTLLGRDLQPDYLYSIEGKPIDCKIISEDKGECQMPLDLSRMVLMREQPSLLSIRYLHPISGNAIELASGRFLRVKTH
jgi:hypothetical protein